MDCSTTFAGNATPRAASAALARLSRRAHGVRRRFVRAALAAIAAGALAACGGGDSAPAPVGGLTVVPGDSHVTVTWTADPNVDYWLFYAPASSITTANWVDIPGSRALQNVHSPLLVTGLTNGTTYSFTMNGRTKGGPGGPGTPSVSAVPRPAGEIWSLGGTLGTSDMRAIAFGTAAGTTINSFVAVGLGGALYQSTDGITWSAVTPTSSADLHAAVYALGRYIAVGAAGTIRYSTDIATWTAAASATTANLNAVAANAGLAVAVGDSGTIRFSSDGVNWIAAATVPTTSNLYGVTYSSSNLWIAVGAGGVLLTSTDGSNWSSVNSGTTADLRAVAVLATFPNLVATYAHVAVGAGGVVARSTDGATWSAQTLAAAPEFTALVAPSPSQFVAVGRGGVVMTSLDGVTWLARASGTTADLYGLIVAANQYTAMGQGGVSIYSR